MDKEFMDLDLVRYLEKENTKFYSIVEELYEKCKKMLALIPACFPNYTLHDIGHSVRVIEYMTDLIKVRLSDYSCLHILLIIAVGLLHDIGMVVNDQEIDELYEKFQKGNKKFAGFSDKQKKNYLQEYIRKQHGKRVANALQFELTETSKISSLFYVGDTMSYNLNDTVARICCSHTESCDWIARNLSIKEVYGDYEINPQHIAILLRIGDALDIDDRRAPYFLYKLLTPTGRSDIEWQKHIPIQNYKKVEWDKDKELYKLIFTGECVDQKIYREIMGYIQNLQCDLQAAIKLGRKFSDVYRLSLCETITSTLVTKGFETTSLRFSLDYQQISSLLMGEKVYGSKKDGLRELIQNAIDAVLLMKDINGSNIYSNYSPMVGIEIDEKRQEIVVFDNGTGMSQEILQRFFFNIGSSFYTSPEFLYGGHDYEPIGHFGIGFLACFMLSSSITIRTKHYNENDTYEMSFDRNSPYVTKKKCEPSFPEGHGTHIIMNYSQVIPEVFGDVESIEKYLQELLVFSGYKLVLIHNQHRKDIELTKCWNNRSYARETMTISFSHDEDFNVKFNMMRFFDDNEYVTLCETSVHDDIIVFDDYLDLGTLEEIVNEIEQLLELNDITVDKALERLPGMFHEWIVHNVKTYKSFIRKKGIRMLLERYLSSFIREDRLEWYEYPVVYNNSQLLRLIEATEQLGTERALQRYKDEVNYIKIISRKHLSSEQVLSIIDNHIIITADPYDNLPCLSYYQEYPLPKITGWCELLALEGTDDRICVESDYLIQSSQVYLKGILVKNEVIRLPYAISGVGFFDVRVNILSGDYCTDVAREKLDDISRERLIANVARMLYMEFIERVNLSKNEKEIDRTVSR